jgi:dTDP-4-dehydrorhamnose reductase
VLGTSLLRQKKTLPQNLNSEVPLPRTAIIGATGYVGSHFLKAYRSVYPDLLATARKPSADNMHPLELRRPNISALKLKQKGYTDALIFAAISRITDANDDQAAWAINVDGTLQLISQLAQEGIKPIFASSDYVFDGQTGSYDDDAPLNPITAYGQHKAEVEERIDAITGGNYLVLRLGKVYSTDKGDGTLIDEMASLLASGGQVRAAYDQILNPVLIDDLIIAVAAIQSLNSTGTMNVCSPEHPSRYELALMVARAMKVSEDNVERISLDDLGFGPKRPKDTSMLTGRLSRELNCEFTPLCKTVETVADNWAG